MMDDEITIEGVSALLIQLAAVQMERDEERARANALAAEVERLEAENAAYRSEWRAREALSRLNIEYDGSDPLSRLVEEVTTLRAQLAAREHAACPHCGQSLHGEQLLPF